RWIRFSEPERDPRPMSPRPTRWSSTERAIRRRAARSPPGPFAVPQLGGGNVAVRDSVQRAVRDVVMSPWGARRRHGRQTRWALRRIVEKRRTTPDRKSYRNSSRPHSLGWVGYWVDDPLERDRQPTTTTQVNAMNTTPPRPSTHSIDELIELAVHRIVQA